MSGNIPKPKSFEELIQSMEDSLRGSISPNIILDNTTVLGNLANTVAAWTKRYVDNELQNAVQSTFWRTATSSSLDSLFELVGVQRLAAKPSEVIGILEVAGNSTVPEGSRATFTTGSFESPFIWRLAGDVVNNDASPAFLSGTFEAETNGPVPFLAPNTLNTIVTPESGWLSINNPDGSVPGRFEERDSEFKLRQQRNLRLPGAGTFASIKANLASVQGVLNLEIFENVSNVTDARGIPPNAFSVVAQFDANPDLQSFTEILLTKSPLGSQSFGSQPVSFTDPTTNITLKGAYTPAQQIDLYLWVDVYTDPQTSIGQTTYRQNIAQYFLQQNLNKLGQDLDVNRLYDRASTFTSSNIRQVEVFVNTTNDQNTAISSGKIDVLVDQFLNLDPANITLRILEFNDA
jgi:hypothetical protein